MKAARRRRHENTHRWCHDGEWGPWDQSPAGQGPPDLAGRMGDAGAPEHCGDWVPRLGCVGVRLCTGPGSMSPRPGGGRAPARRPPRPPGLRGAVAAGPARLLVAPQAPAPGGRHHHGRRDGGDRRGAHHLLAVPLPGRPDAQCRGRLGARPVRGQPAVFPAGRVPPAAGPGLPARRPGLPRSDADRGGDRRGGRVAPAGGPVAGPAGPGRDYLHRAGPA